MFKDINFLLNVIKTQKTLMNTLFPGNELL